MGLDAGKPILEAAGQLMGCVSFFENFVQITILMIAWAIVILAVQLFITLIEFKLTTLAGFVLVPFGLFNKTSFLAEKVLGVVASGVKILVLAVIIGIGTSLFLNSPRDLAAISRRSRMFSRNPVRRHSALDYLSPTQFEKLAAN